MDRARRLSEAYDVKKTRSRGASAACGPLVARILPNTLEPARNRYTVIAGKKVGKAHDRNRCKRVTREALRQFDANLRQGLDIVIIVRGGVDELTGLDVAEQSLREIFRKAKVLTDG
jgi:ribonuclease P protein component